MCLEELLSGQWVQGQALEQSNHKADAIGAGEFEVGRWGKFQIYFDYFLEQNGDGPYRIPQQHW